MGNNLHHLDSKLQLSSNNLFLLDINLQFGDKKNENGKHSLAPFFILVIVFCTAALNQWKTRCILYRITCRIDTAL